MNKKGDLFGIIMFIMICVIIWFAYMGLKNLPKDTRTPEQLAQEQRDRFLAWNANENKYCQGLGAELNDTYKINDCQMVVCQTKHNLTTYSFCSSKDKDGSFVGGLIIGHLIFGK